MALALAELLKTSLSAEDYKTAIIVEVVSSAGLTGRGETELKATSFCGAAAILSARHIARDYLIRKLKGRTINTPREVPALLAARGNHHARAGVAAAS